MNYIDKVLKDFRNKWGRFYYSDTVGMDWEKPKKQNVAGDIPDGHNGFCIASIDIENDIKQSLLTLQEQHEAEIKELKNKKYKEMLIEYMNDMHAIDENDALQQLAYEKGRHIAREQHKKELSELRDDVFNIDFYNDKEREKIRDKFNKYI